MLKVPSCFFNNLEIIKIGTETVFNFSLVINGREIEKASLFFSRSVYDKLKEFAKLEDSQKIPAQVKDI